MFAGPSQAELDRAVSDLPRHLLMRARSSLIATRTGSRGAYTVGGHRGGATVVYAPTILGSIPPAGAQDVFSGPRWFR